MYLPTYLPTYLCESSDSIDKSDSRDISDSRGSSDRKDKRYSRDIKKDFTKKNIYFNKSREKNLNKNISQVNFSHFVLFTKELIPIKNKMNKSNRVKIKKLK